MRLIDPEDYGPALSPLLEPERLNPLGLGEPDAVARPLLEALSQEHAFPVPVADQQMAEACFAGLWLYYDHGDTCHRLVQSMTTPTGSYWHGIFHRREPDYRNCKGWFRRVGAHPVFEPLGEAARTLAHDYPESEAAEILARQDRWDPLHFIDLCEITHDTGSQTEALCRAIQQAEWELLFDFSYRTAIETNESLLR